MWSDIKERKEKYPMQLLRAMSWKSGAAIIKSSHSRERKGSDQWDMKWN